jgi:2-polyprenyl-3-methyl-5-hydroxy-6-metoxy-1,4-benzoquinol methylase/putative flippase GtrA
MSQQFAPTSLRLMRSFIAGGITGAFELGAFVALIWLVRLPAVYAAPLSLGIGLVVNFSLSRHWVFAPSGKRLQRELSQFATIAIIDLAGEWLTFVLLYRLSPQAIVAKVLTMALWFFINFILKQEVFRAAEAPSVLLNVLRLYGNVPLRQRLHIAMRWLSAPLEVLARKQPTAGKVLEIGCGRGSLLLYLASMHSHLYVTGTDIDERKLELAKAVARASGLTSRTQFVRAGKTSELPGTQWDAIILADVLYLLPYGEQQDLLDWAAGHLRLGGHVFVKGMSLRPRWKFVWNKLQESISVKLLHATAAEGGFYFRDPSEFARILEAAGLTVNQQPLDHGYVHPHYLIIGQQSRHKAGDLPKEQANLASLQGASIVTE